MAKPVGNKAQKFASASLKRKAIVVLGMHRSGTSALARSLGLLGADLPKNPIAADENNSSGYWEPLQLTLLNNQLLLEAGSRWDDWRPFSLDGLSKPRKEFYRSEIARVLDEEYGGSSLIVLKEPRISRLVPLYDPVLRSLGFEPAYVNIVRNPLAVTASLNRRDKMSVQFASLIWLRYLLDAERSTRSVVRTFVSYERLLTDWRKAIDQMTGELGLSWPRPVNDASADLDVYLTQDLQHYAPSSELLYADESMSDWSKDAYSQATALIADRNDDAAMTEIDRIVGEFDNACSLLGDAIFTELQLREARQAATDEPDFAARESELKRAVAVQHEMIRRLTGERDRLKEMLVAKTADPDKQHARIAALQAELNAANKAAAEAESRFRRERDELAASKRSLEQSSAVETEAAAKALAEARDAEVALRQEIACHLDEKAAAERRIGELETANAAIERRLDALSPDLVVANGISAGAAQREAGSRMDVAPGALENETQDSDPAIWKAGIADVSDIQRLNESLVEKTQELAESRASEAGLQSELARTLAEHASEISHLNTKFVEESRKRAEFLAREDDLRSALEKVRAEASVRISQLSQDLTDRSTEYQSEIDKRAKENGDLVEALRTAQASIRRFSEELQMIYKSRSWRIARSIAAIVSKIRPRTGGHIS